MPVLVNQQAHQKSGYADRRVRVVELDGRLLMEIFQGLSKRK